MFGDNMISTTKLNIFFLVGFAVIFCAIVVIQYARSKNDYGAVVIKQSYNWQLHDQLIADLFVKTSKADLISVERKTIETILPKEKADAYMKYFEDGMDSTVGIILIEHEKNAWLEQAYRKGFQTKTVFKKGYMEGLLQSAEHPDVMKKIK